MIISIRDSLLIGNYDSCLLQLLKYEPVQDPSKLITLAMKLKKKLLKEAWHLVGEDDMNYVYKSEDFIKLESEAAVDGGVVLKGHLLKKNWYMNKQLRYFVLYSHGEIKYYKDEIEPKGTIVLGPNSYIRKTARNEITLYC